jgi:phosphogluconate dehydratase
MGYLMGELLQHGLLHGDAATIAGSTVEQALREPKLADDGQITWHEIPQTSGNKKILATVNQPFSPNGGLKMLTGNLGEAVIKVSAVKVEHYVIEAPARVFDDQNAMLAAFKADELNQDFIAVLRFQGPRANGMPELHKLTPALGVLQDRGFKVALVTDGRMSGASGKIPAAIHLTPEAVEGGILARLADGDMLRLDAENGSLEVLADKRELMARQVKTHNRDAGSHGMGRELFARMRAKAGPANQGASIL